LKIFIDVNIFIDVMTKRSGWAESLRVVNLARNSREIDASTSALTLPLIYFFRHRVVDESRARNDAQAILKNIELVPLTPAIIARALVAAGADFEDNIQITSAESIGVDHLITRNKKDFTASLVPVSTPDEWLELPEVVALEANLP
jgi:predicted nucleic acid-binding protein